MYSTTEFKAMDGTVYIMTESHRVSSHIVSSQQILAILLNMCFHALSDHFVLMCEYSGYQCFRGSSLQLHGTLLNAVSRQSLFIRLKYDPRVFVVMRVLRETLIAFEIVRVKRRLGPLQAHSVVSLELDTILGDSQSLSRLRQALYGHAGDRTRRKVPSNALADDANQIISRFNEAAFKRLLSSCEIRAPVGVVWFCVGVFNV